jgi:hypothetical protein
MFLRALFDELDYKIDRKTTLEISDSFYKCRGPNADSYCRKVIIETLQRLGRALINW